MNAVVTGSEQFKAIVSELIQQSGINPKDPMFQVFKALGEIEEGLKALPTQLGTVVESWTVEIDRHLDKAADVAILQQKSAIAKAAQTLFTQANRQNTKFGLGALIPAGLVLSGVLVGILATVMIPIWRGGGLTEPIRLTLSEKNALNWVLSNEGKQARNLWEWNRFELFVCQANSDRLKGRCAIWIVPYNQRQKYVDRLNP